MLTDKKNAAVEIVKKLREAGYTAFFAGGCVRDMLLGRAAKDYDVATNAHPDEVMTPERLAKAITEQKQSPAPQPQRQPGRKKRPHQQRKRKNDH